MATHVGIIPARYNSSRFPGKPLALIKGKSLIQRTYESASQCDKLDEVIVATDDQRIYDHVVGFGGKVVMTASDHKSGSDRLAEVVANLEADIVVNIQGDWPCIEPHVIGAVVDALENDSEAVMGTAVIPIKDETSRARNSLVKCVYSPNKRALYFSRAAVPGSAHLGIYSYRPDFLAKFAALPRTPLEIAEDLEQLRVLEHGFQIAIAEVDSHVLSVDRPEDIAKVEEFLCNLSTCS